MTVHTEPVATVGEKWRAPFTAAQVAALNEYQRSPGHPYTCRVDSNHPPLVAYEGGWWCKDKLCEYTQDWAHPLEITLRHVLIAADLVSRIVTMPDGYASIAMRSREEAADLALAALTQFGRLLPDGDVRSHVVYRCGSQEGLWEAEARELVGDGMTVEQRTVTEHATRWEPFNG